MAEAAVCVYDLSSVCTPSGMMMASAVPTSSPAPSTDTLCSFSSLMEKSSGADPEKYEPKNITCGGKEIKLRGGGEDGFPPIIH